MTPKEVVMMAKENGAKKRIEPERRLIRSEEDARESDEG